MVGTQPRGPGSSPGLRDPHTHSGGAGPGRVAWGRAGHPLSCLSSTHCSSREHPQPPPASTRQVAGRWAESSLRLRLPQFNSLPNVCHHPQNCNRGPGGCTGARWPGDAVSLGRLGDLPPPQPGLPRRRRRGEGAPKHRPTRQLRGEKVRREIQDSLCVWTRPRETGAPRGK